MIFRKDNITFRSTKTVILLTLSALSIYNTPSLADSTDHPNAAQLQALISQHKQASEQQDSAATVASNQAKNDLQFSSNPFLSTNQTNQQALHATTATTNNTINTLNASSVTANLQPLSIEGFSSDSQTNDLDNTGDATTVADLQTQYSNMLDDLSINIPASDLTTPNYTYTEGDDNSNSTLNDPIAYGGTLSKSTYGVPTTNYDSYFNVSSLLGTDNYTDANAETAAQYYIRFATNPIPLNLQLIPHLSTLQTTITQATDDSNSNSNTTKAAITRNLITSPVYKQYLIDERNITAEQSLSTDAYHYLYSKRKANQQSNDENLNNLYATIHPEDPTPNAATDTDGNAIMDPTTNQPALLYPSEEETTNYLATHDLADPAYYQHVASESETNVLRDSLLTNKLIAKELNSQNKTHERELALLANISLQLTNQSKTAMSAASEAKTIDSWITKLPSPATDPGQIPELTDDPTAQVNAAMS